MSVEFSAKTIISMGGVLGPRAVERAAVDKFAKLQGVRLATLQSIRQQVEAKQVDLTDPEQLKELKKTFGDHKVEVYLVWSKRN